jgi:hypothetical protein
MKGYKGIVKNNVVLLQEGIRLPDGTFVEVRVRRKRGSREERFRRILDNPITHPVGMDEIVERDKQEREERWDFGGRTQP